jgi:hypothetical protein
MYDVIDGVKTTEALTSMVYQTMQWSAVTFLSVYVFYYQMKTIIFMDYSI